MDTFLAFIILYLILYAFFSSFITNIVTPYELFRVSHDVEHFDILLGNIIREEKNIYRRHRKKRYWQIKTEERFGIVKPLFKRARVTLKSEWRDVPMSSWVELEKLVKQKTLH